MYAKPSSCVALLIVLLGAAPVEGRAARWEPRSWQSKKIPAELRALNDGDELSVVPFWHGTDFGLETSAPTEINRFVVRYVSLHGRFLQPKPGAAPLEVWTDGKWQPVRADVEIDYSRWRELAPWQMYGTVVWTYRFAPVSTTRVRVRVQESDVPLRWYMTLSFQGALVREVQASSEQQGKPGERFTGSITELCKPDPGPRAGVHRQGERLTDPVYQPRIVRRAGATEVSWPRKRLVSMVSAGAARPGSGPGFSPLTVLWWDGSAWRPTEALRLPPPTNPTKPGDYSFQPVATERLKFLGPAEHFEKVHVYLCRNGQEYLDRARIDPTDVLGLRAIASGDPDLSGVTSLLLPLTFLKGFTGRAEDVEETMLTCDGKLVLRTGTGREQQHRFDRFVAFGVDGRAIGETPEEISRRLIDGWMPGVIYELHTQGVVARMTAFTTAPGDDIYGDRVHWDFEPPAEAARDIFVDVILGNRLTTYAYFEQEQAGRTDPSMFAPLECKYRLQPDGRTVAAEDGSVVLWSSARGQWSGTAREPRLTVRVPLRIGRPATLDLIVPHPGAAPPGQATLEKAGYQRSLELFRDNWSREIASTAQFIVPEPAVNDAIRSALCQCLIIPDQGIPFYGAYWYEWCIGLEEWWPTIALAQFGREADGKKHAAAIVGQYLKDPSHHFPYRNGLAGMGAAEIALLTGDFNCYRGLTENLKTRAEWTIRSCETDNRGTPYEGLIRKFAYGGDIGSPAHSLYSNVTCWRGLRDTGRMLAKLGDATTSARYLDAAESLRQRIMAFWEAKIDRRTTPPFVPYAFDIGHKDKNDLWSGKYIECERPYPVLNRDPLGNYWNLFMQMVPELRFYPAGRKEVEWLPEYCEKHGGVAVGLARYYNSVDWHYGAGYIKHLLWSGQREKFLLSFYSALAHGAAQDVRTSPEDCSIWPARTRNEASRAEYDAARWNWQSGWDEPLSAAPGATLQLLRTMLVDESQDDNGDDGSLILLSGIPRAWLADGKEIRVIRAPTHYGTLSLHVVSRVGVGRIEADLAIEPREPIRQIVVKLFHPERRPLRNAAAGGRKVRLADAETVVFSPGGERSFHLTAEF